MTLTLTEAESDVLAAMRQAGGFRSDEDTVKGALWWYARFLEIDVPRRPERADDDDQGELF